VKKIKLYESQKTEMMNLAETSLRKEAAETVDKMDLSRVSKTSAIGRRRFEIPPVKRWEIESIVKTQLGNFVGGLFRGIGMGVGFTLLTAALILIMGLIVSWNLPYISEFIARVMKMAEFSMHGGTAVK